MSEPVVRRGLIGRLAHGLMQPSEESMTVLLVWLVILLFVASPLLPREGAGAYLLHALFSLVLLSSTFSLPKRFRTISAVIAVLSFGTGWLTYAVAAPPLFIANVVFTITFVGIATLGILTRIFAPGPVTRFRIHGAIVVYLLSGLFFGLVFACIFLLDHAAFNTPETVWEGSLRLQYDKLLGRFTYFSFVTLTTLGYGDITPINGAARQLVVLEALMGQLYPAVLLARLVSMELASRPNGTD